jgi:hypothetical protein
MTISIRSLSLIARAALLGSNERHSHRYDLARHPPAKQPR